MVVGRIKHSGQGLVLVANDYGATVESLRQLLPPDRKALRNLERGERRRRIKQRFTTEHKSQGTSLVID